MSTRTDTMSKNAEIETGMNADPKAQGEPSGESVLGATPCSASDLLRAEADRLGGVRKNKPIEADLRWAYSVAAAWLDCRNDPATIRKWQEIPEQNAELTHPEPKPKDHE